MAIRRLDKVFCSLNLGFIYNLSYAYSPENGVTITLFFVNESGEYTAPPLSTVQKVSIRIGGASFSMYPIRSSISYSSGRRVLKVDFVDEMHKLDKYLVVLNGRGCGRNVYSLGRPVDNRTNAQKIASSLDPVAQQIKDFTQFPDLEYGFNDFLVILKEKFNVIVSASFNTTITKPITGTFREVLNGWCNLYNLSYFFENGAIKIFDPTKLTVNLPPMPDEAIEYEIEEDITDTYGITVSNYFQQNGGQQSLNQASNALLTKVMTLYPIGYEFNLPQTNLALDQVVASMYGKEFWFLYNRYKGSAAEECGWINSATATSSAASLATTLSTFGMGAVILDDVKFEEKFAAYRGYAQNIAGRWYLSNEVSDTTLLDGYQWFDITQGDIFDFATADNKQVQPVIFQQAVSTLQAIPDTIINRYYPGVNYVGNRMAFKDNREIDFSVELPLTDVEQKLLAATYQAIFSTNGSENLPWPANQKYRAYNTTVSIPSQLQTLFDGISKKTDLFKARFTSVGFKGIKKADYNSLKASQNEPAGVEVITTAGPNVVSNTGVLKTVKSGSYTVYYDKYQQCASASSEDNHFGFRFNIQQISDDNQIGFTFAQTSKTSYKLTRDVSVLTNLVNNPLLPSLAQPRTFSTKRVAFSLNYFYAVPTDFLSSGLVGVDMQISESGQTATYRFSNEVLRVPDLSRQYNLVEEQIRNSWIRSYRPPETIS